MEGYPGEEPPLPDQEHIVPEEFIDEVFTANQLELERFAEMPNRREALRAKDSDNFTVFLSHAIAKKLYRCPCCTGDIAIGSEHVIINRVQMSKQFTHHHLDFKCTQQIVLPTLREIRVIDPKETSATAMNRRGRRYRNRHRRA